jgi:hypothetical protein
MLMFASMLTAQEKKHNGVHLSCGLFSTCSTIALFCTKVKNAGFMMLIETCLLGLVGHQDMNFYLLESCSSKTVACERND